MPAAEHMIAGDRILRVRIRDVPANTIVAGNPARGVRAISASRR
jgi:acetyltransferase-like isoleucine patch superfamily enzyme